MLNRITIPFLFLLDILVLLDRDFHGFLVASVFLMIYLFVENHYDTLKLDKWIYISVYILNILAFLFDFYHIEWFDDVAHTLTPLALVMYVGPYIYKDVLNKKSVSVIVKFFALVTLGLAAGISWEVWEYYADITIFEELAPTLHDTITDILFDTIGTVIGTIVILTHE